MFEYFDPAKPRKLALPSRPGGFTLQAIFLTPRLTMLNFLKAESMS
jgi:hypothetical protein